MNVPPPAVAARLAGVESSPVREILALTQRPGIISFAGGLPAPELFPADELREAFARALAGDGARTGLQYSTTEGDPRLRAALAEVLTARGLPTTADEVVVTTGSQQGLSLVAAVLLDPGDTVLVEEPSYLAALQCFAMAGARVVGVPCDEDGLDPDALATLVAAHRPSCYTIPTFQNPTGRTLPVGRRAAVAQAAASLGLWVLEDDPYRELRFEGEPLAPVASYPGAEDRVIASSSLSKVLAPGCGSAGCGRPRRSAARSSSPNRRRTSTPRRSTRPRPRSPSPEGGWTGICCGHGPPTASAWDALVDGLGAALPLWVGVEPPGRGHVRLGPAPRRSRRHGAAAHGDRAGRGVRPGCTVLRRAARRRHAAALVHRAPAGGDPRGAGGLAGRRGADRATGPIGTSDPGLRDQAAVLTAAATAS